MHKHVPNKALAMQIAILLNTGGPIVVFNVHLIEKYIKVNKRDNIYAGMQSSFEMNIFVMSCIHAMGMSAMFSKFSKFCPFLRSFLPDACKIK